MSVKTLFLGVRIDKKDVDQIIDPFFAKSLFDYDIVVIDPDVVLFRYGTALSFDVFNEYDSNVYGRTRTINRRLYNQAELLLEKGGLLICLFRPTRGFAYSYSGERARRRGYHTNYDWIPIEDLMPRGRIINGRGNRIKLSSKPNDFDQYLRMPGSNWLAYFNNLTGLNEELECLAFNDADKCISLEIKVRNGYIIFLPFLSHEKAPHIILQCATRYYNRKKLKFRPKPPWLFKYQVPHEKEFEDDIRTYSEKIKQLSDEKKKQQDILNNLINVKRILYEADDVLEEAIKETFKELGLCLEKKDDMDWISSSDEYGAILEVTGSEASIDVVKFRQLLNYLLTDYEKTREEKKAILVGNHFLNHSLDERGPPFTDKAIQEAELHSICLLTTSELFKVICNVREGKISKEDIWTSILRTTGVYVIEN